MKLNAICKCLSNQFLVLLVMLPCVDTVVLLTAILSLCQAAEFRQLWGSRSELRRFQDGAITEAVLWSGETSYEKRLVPRQIIAHLLQL